jgi:hypothetical protein
MCIECQKYAVIKLQDFCQYEDKNKEKSLRYIFFSTLGIRIDHKIKNQSSNRTLISDWLVDVSDYRLVHFISDVTHMKTGTYKVRNEIETKSTKTKRNQQKRNEINEMKTKTKRNTMLDYFPHISQCTDKRTYTIIFDRICIPPPKKDWSI